jgi:exopolysaccharide biosynthesis polyprenyl glycosylphosphotransferase
MLSAIVYEYLQVGKRIHYTPASLFVSTVSFAVLFVFLMERDGGYNSANSLLRIRETERVLRVSFIAFGILFLLSLLSPHLISRAMLGGALIAVPFALAVQKQVVQQMFRFLHTRGFGIQNVIVYGAGETGKRLFSALIRSPKLGLRPTAIVDDDPAVVGRRIKESGYSRQLSLVVRQGPITETMIRELDARLVLVGIPGLSREQLNALAEEAFAADSAMAFVPPLSCDSETAAPGCADIDGILVASFVPPVRKRWYELGKRLFDIAVSCALLLAISPMLLLIALFVRIDSPGPVFFHQARVGRGGVLFTLFKFRSMRVDSPKYGYHPRSARDPRITRVGKWLRRTSLDELPQLINVIRGDMSLVGPRPEMPFIVQKYDSYQRQRLEVTPGITGLWQISADRASLIHENLQYDLYYIRHRNFFMDLALLAHTAIFAVRGT